MPRFNRIVFAVLGLSLLGRGMAADFYVATNGSDAWSGRLAAPNAARTDGPLATLHRARDAVRALKAMGLREPIRVIVRGGTYYLGKPVVLGPQDSGSNTCSVSYEAAKAEKVVLSGGKRVANWTTDDGRVWYADVPGARGGKWKFRQLFVNGRREIRARYPNFDPGDPIRGGWLYATHPEAPWGIIVRGFQNVGDWMEYDVDVPADGAYSLWIRYGTTGPWRPHFSVEAKTTGSKLIAKFGPSVYKDKLTWRKAGELHLREGKQTLRWTIITQAALLMDGFVLTTDPEWRPKESFTPPARSGHHMIVTQGEAEHRGQTQIGYSTWEAGKWKRDRFVIPCARGAIKPAWGRAPDAEVFVVAAYGWFSEIVKLQSIDMENSYIRISGKECQDRIFLGNRFYVMGVREELDQPREWYLDTDKGRLYYWPPDGDPNKSTVVAPVLDRIFELSADSNGEARVRHIAIRGFTFTDVDYTVGHTAVRAPQDAAIQMVNACDCVVEDCTFTNIGGYGVRMHLDSCGNRIAGNHVYAAGAGGVIMTSAKMSYGKLHTPGEAAAKLAPLRNVITRNHVHHSGKYRFYCAGVHADSRPKGTAQMEGNVVTHNHIHHMPRLGFFGFGNQGGNTIAFNHIHHVLQECDDGGAINFATMNEDAAPNSIHDNFVHDVIGLRWGRDGKVKRCLGFGIYLDHRTSNCDIRNNVVARTHYGALMIHSGRNNVVENNIFAEDGFNHIFLSDYTTTMSGNVIRRNIIYWTQPDVSLALLTTGGAKKGTKERRLAIHANPRLAVEMDDNVLWHAGLAIGVRPWEGKKDLEYIDTIEKWRARGMDVNSVVADPLFADAANDDYRLRRGSPAFKVGFKPIDLSWVGGAGHPSAAR